MMGKFEKAIADYDDAISLDSKDAKSINQLAWLLATCADEEYRDGRRAVQLAMQAGELSHFEDPNILDTLAAACAEAGDFEHAVEWQTKARDLAPQHEQADYQSRLDLYAGGQPYHQSAVTASADAPAAPTANVAAQ